MSVMFFQEDDFVITFDPEKVTGVRTYTISYGLLFDEDNVELIPKKYETLCKLILDLVKDNFEKPELPAQTQLTYKLERFVTSCCFVLSFPNLEDYIEALSRIKEMLIPKFGLEPKIDERVRDLQFAVNIPHYYSDYKENKTLIISILGEPDEDKS